MEFDRNVYDIKQVFLNFKDILRQAENVNAQLTMQNKALLSELDAFKNDNEGIESIRNAVQELERNGYLTRQKVHLGQGKFDTDYILHITPQLGEKSDPLEIDPLESRRVGFPPLENHPNNSNKEFSKKEEQIKREQTLANFENFWNLYDKKEDSKKCKDLFTNLPEQTQQKILQVAPLYVKKTPDKKFRKHPLTWLRGSCWEDDYSDIVKQTQESKPEPKLFYTNEDYEAALAKWNAKNATSNLHDI